MTIEFKSALLTDLAFHLINALAHQLANKAGNLESPATIDEVYGFIGMGPVGKQVGMRPPPLLTNVEAGECLDALHDHLLALPADKRKEVEWWVFKKNEQGGYVQAAVGQVTVRTGQSV